MHSPSLINAILSCTTQEELEEFLIDLLTPAEREEFTQRLDIAHRLYTKQSYKNIEQYTNASSTTIARVAKFLHRPKSGYITIFSKLSS